MQPLADFAPVAFLDIFLLGRQFPCRLPGRPDRPGQQQRGDHHGKHPESTGPVAHRLHCPPQFRRPPDLGQQAAEGEDGEKSRAGQVPRKREIGVIAEIGVRPEKGKGSCPGFQSQERQKPKQGTEYSQRRAELRERLRPAADHVIRGQEGAFD